MRPNEPVVTLRGTKLRETGKAAQFKIEYINDMPLEPSKTEWFPFSQISKMTHDPQESPSDTMIVSVWILGEKGLSASAPKSKVAPEDTPLYAPESDDFDRYDDIPF